jgi:hypothetical protein
MTTDKVRAGDLAFEAPGVTPATQVTKSVDP